MFIYYKYIVNNAFQSKERRGRYSLQKGKKKIIIPTLVVMLFLGLALTPGISATAEKIKEHNLTIRMTDALGYDIKFQKLVTHEQVEEVNDSVSEFIMLTKEVLDEESPEGSEVTDAEWEKLQNKVFTVVDILAKIVGKELLSNPLKRNEFLINLATSLRAIEHSENIFSSKVDELYIQGLYQRPLVWILLKDIVCPIYNTTLKNIRIVAGDNPQSDIARYYEKGEIDVGDFENYPFIFLNEVDNKPVLNALLFIEALKAHELDPVKVLLDVSILPKKTIYCQGFYHRKCGVVGR